MENTVKMRVSREDFKVARVFVASGRAVMFQKDEKAQTNHIKNG